MGVLVSRRSEPQTRGTTIACAVACLLMCACTGGTGSPIIDISDGGSELVTGGSGGSRSGFGRADAGTDIDDTTEEAAQTTECKFIESMWPTTYAADEMKLFNRFNQLRSSTSELCPPSPFGPQPPVELSLALECSARMKLLDDNLGRGASGGPPDYYAQIRTTDGAFRDRSHRSSAQIEAEVTFSNVSSVDEIVELLKDNPSDAGSFCYIASAWLPQMGVARRGSVWVLDFGSAVASGTPSTPTGGGPRPPNTSNAGNSGRGSGGMGGR